MGEKITITVLVENATSKKHNKVCSSEWGISMLIETAKSSILFDVGHSSLYWDNAAHMGINLDTVDCVALSHHHRDHVGGVQYHRFSQKKRLVLHPEVLVKVPVDVSAVLQRDFDVVPSVGVVECVPNILFLGEIPRVVSYESGVHKGDKMHDDTALAIQTSHGVIVVTGCSHAGISNICEYAKKMTQLPLYGVVGGFHLFEKDGAAVDGAIDYFMKEGVQHLYPMHCIDLPTLAKFYNTFQVKKVGAGDTIVFDRL